MKMQKINVTNLSKYQTVQSMKNELEHLIPVCKNSEIDLFNAIKTLNKQPQISQLEGDFILGWASMLLKHKKRMKELSNKLNN